MAYFTYDREKEGRNKDHDNNIVRQNILSGKFCLENEGRISPPPGFYIPFETKSFHNTEKHNLYFHCHGK